MIITLLSVIWQIFVVGLVVVCVKVGTSFIIWGFKMILPGDKPEMPNAIKIVSTEFTKRKEKI